MEVKIPRAMTSRWILENQIGCDVRFLCVGAAAQCVSPLGVVMLSTLITGLDGRSNFERNGGALAPFLHPPLAHFLYNR
jgi:hypothetical protein